MTDFTESDRDRAVIEANCMSKEDEYFAARPQIDFNDRRKVFQAGFERAWQAAKEAGIKEALAAADTVRLNLAKRYDDAADTNTCQMDGNMDWARLAGAVKAVQAIRALKEQKHDN